MKLSQTISNLYVFIFFIFSFVTIVTAQKTIIPKTGSVVFEKAQKVTNQMLYDSTITIFHNKIEKVLKKQMIEEFEKQGMVYDDNSIEVLLSNSVKAFSFELTNEVVEKYHIFKDSIITAYRKVNNAIQGDYQLINQNQNTYNIRAKIDSTFIPIKDKLYEHLKEDHISITEYKDQVKTINGFDCYKVIIIKDEVVNANEEDISFFKDVFETMQTQYVLYVTESIKCKYHPVIMYKSILEKYYPLEIRKYSMPIEGVETIYLLKEFSIKE